MIEKEQLERLPEGGRRGSKARCHIITHGDRAEVARKLTDLVGDNRVVVRDNDHWLPRGFDDIREAQLDKEESLLPDNDAAMRLKKWWLKVPKNARTPNWDIASTCSIDGTPGLLLVEAKAHSNEVSEAGKQKSGVSENSKANRESILNALAEANTGLNALLNGFALSADSNYQVANRFAWSWKLASMGIPTVLAFLGFLDAPEMTDRGSVFTDYESWANELMGHTHNTVPSEFWNRWWSVADTPLLVRITARSVPIS